jgi:CRP-like cAMP-binding protein
VVNFRSVRARRRIPRPTSLRLALPRRTHAGHLSIFEGLPPEELAHVVASLELRVYEAGQTVIAEGDRSKEIFIAQAGSADVLIAGEDGSETLVGRIVP